MWAGRTSLAFPRTALLQDTLGGLTGLDIGPNLPPVQAGYKSTIRHVCDSRAALDTVLLRPCCWLDRIWRAAVKQGGEDQLYRQWTALGDRKPGITGEESVLWLDGHPLRMSNTSPLEHDRVLPDPVASPTLMWRGFMHKGDKKCQKGMPCLGYCLPGSQCWHLLIFFQGLHRKWGEKCQTIERNVFAKL